MTTEWVGWSAEWEHVDQTRILAQLLMRSSTDPGVDSVQDAIQAAHLHRNLDPSLIEQMFCEAGWFTQMATPYGGTILGLPLTTTAAGHRIAGEFRQATGQRIKMPAARRAILLWLDDSENDGMADLDAMLNAPHSWFYGRQFTGEELSAAATNLEARGYLEAITPWNGPVLRAKLTPKGRSCVELYAGDPDQMETPVISGHQFNFGSYTQQGGNTAFGSPVGVQNSTTVVSNGQAATQLLEILQALDRLGAIPPEQQAEAGNVSADLQTALSEQAEPADLWHRAGSFLQRLNARANDNTAISLLMVAGLNVAAMKAGLGTPS